MEENRSTDLTLAAHVCASYRDAFPKVAFDPQWLRIPYRSLPTLRCPFAGITVAETQCRIFTGFRYVLSLSILFFLSTLYPLLSGFTMEAMIFAPFGFAMTGIHDFTYTKKNDHVHSLSPMTPATTRHMKNIFFLSRLSLNTNIPNNTVNTVPRPVHTA